jgi:uncharacterized protein YggT (Ycf19 family)
MREWEVGHARQGSRFGTRRAGLLGMAIDRRDPDTTERVDRYERERIVERPSAYPAPGSSNVNVGPTSTTAGAAASTVVLTVTRVITLIFSVLEVLLALRFILKLLGANAQQPLIAGLYRITEPLVRPFQGIFPQPSFAAFDLPALLAIVFFFLLGALVIAIVRAVLGARSTY